MTLVYGLRGGARAGTMAAIRSLVSYALEVVFLPLRLALRQPLALLLLAAGLLLALALVVVPELDAWARRAPLILGWGLLAYAAAILIFVRFPAEVRAPEVRQVQQVRWAIARRLAAVRYDRPALAPFLAEAIEHLDHQILPELRQLILRQRGLAEYLAAHDPSTATGRGNRAGARVVSPPPDNVVLERVRATFRRQREAIDECVQQAVNAEATLVALLAVGDDTEVGVKARQWAGDLLSLHDFLAQALRAEPAPDIVSLSPVDAETASSVAPAPVPIPDEGALVRLTEEALREINNHFALAKCGLAEHLPRTLVATREAWGATRLPDVTPLELAQALHEVLVQAIERLKPVDGLSAVDQALRYHVVRERYLEGKDTRQITIHHNISESTLHRYRRQGIEAIARELLEQEALLVRSQARTRADAAASG